MTVYLHIGIGKTGTTSIQTFLEINAAALAKRGIIIPTSLAKRNHRRLTMYALNDDVIDNLRRAKGLLTPGTIQRFREQALKDFSAEIETWPSEKTVVMTSEQMTRLRRPGEVSRLRDFVGLIGDPDIRVIVYLRRQDLYYVSEYSQEIKGGKDIPFSPDGKIVNRNIYFYDRLLSYWEEVFGREALIVRPFEVSVMKNGDAIDDFMTLIGIEDLTGLERPPPRNASLDAHTVEFLRRLNPSIPRWLSNGENPARSRLVEALEAISDGPKLRMSHDNAQRFLSQFAESNAAVGRKYCGKADLFQEPVSEFAGKEPDLPAEIAVRIANRLILDAMMPALGVDQIIELAGWGWQRAFKSSEGGTLAPAPLRKTVDA